MGLPNLEGAKTNFPKGGIKGGKGGGIKGEG